MAGIPQRGGMAIKPVGAEGGKHGVASWPKLTVPTKIYRTRDRLDLYWFLNLVDIVNFCSLVTFPMIIPVIWINTLYMCICIVLLLLLLFIIDYIYFGNYLPVNILCIYHVNMYIIDLALYIWFCRYKQNYMYIQIWGIFEFIRAKYVLYILIILKMAFAEEQWLFNRLSISDC